MNDKLHFAGTESATEFSGYMEGAIISALNITDIFK
jgi:monoamine oxidase